VVAFPPLVFGPIWLRNSLRVMVPDNLFFLLKSSYNGVKLTGPGNLIYGESMQIWICNFADLPCTRTPVPGVRIVNGSGINPPGLTILCYRKGSWPFLAQKMARLPVFLLLKYFWFYPVISSTRQTCFS
jgi:hypothetical protein